MHQRPVCWGTCVPDAAGPANTGDTALLAGATGLVGRECLRLLASDEAFSEVRALLRRPLPAADRLPNMGKVRECITNFDKLADHPEWFAVSHVFCALGTTIKVAGSQAAFRRVDFEYPLAIAELAKAQGAQHFYLVSALGANARSRVFYNRVKGELEDELKALNFASLTIAQPSLLMGERAEFRFGEEVGKRLAWLVPGPWRPVLAAQVAAGLVNAAKAGGSGVQVLSNTQLRANRITKRVA